MTTRETTSPLSTSLQIAESIRHGAAWLIDLARRPPRDGEAALLIVFGLAYATPFDERVIDAAEAVTSDLIAKSGSAIVAASSLMPLLAARALPAKSWTRDALINLSASNANGSSISGWAARQLLTPGMEKSELPPVPSWVPLLSDNTFAYTASPALIRRIADDVGVLTLFGKRSLEFTEDPTELLRFWIFCCIKDDDLDLICPLARALRFLQRERSSDALEFVLDHQRGDGRFSAQELSIAFYAREQPEFDVVYDAYLPLTVASLWTLISLA